MKYFVMVERNPQNENFKRTRLEKLNEIQSVRYDDSTYIYVNNMTYKKMDNSLRSKILADTFLNLVIEKAKTEEIINLDFLFESADKKLIMEDRK